MQPMMACGHAANARTGDGKPCCVICAGIHAGAETVTDSPNMTGRMARCSCGRTVPSSVDLAFFEFCGDGSRIATETCAKCNYSVLAHRPHNPKPYAGAPFEHCAFAPKGAYEFDRFYCGCRGWN
jgi:hypothetical protein